MGYAKLAVLISRNWRGGGRCRFGGSLVPLAPLPLTAVRVGAVCWTVWAIIKSRQSRPEGGFGWWRLTPPWYGDAACGRDGGRGTPHPSRLRRATCLSAGRSVRGSDRPPACHSIPRTHQGEGLGDKKKRPGALLLALFIAFWRCRSGPSGTGVTGHRRGLRRGRRSWENPWHRRP